MTYRFGYHNDNKMMFWHDFPTGVSLKFEINDLQKICELAGTMKVTDEDNFKKIFPLMGYKASLSGNNVILETDSVVTSLCIGDVKIMMRTSFEQVLLRGKFDELGV